MKDKVANVYLGSLTLFSSVIDGFGEGAGASNVSSACDAVLPDLIKKLGDTNVKQANAAKESIMCMAGLNNAAKESIMFMAGLKDAGLAHSTHQFVHPIVPIPILIFFVFLITTSACLSACSNAAKESIMFMAGLKDAGLAHSTHQFVKPIKNQNAWKPVLGILNLLQELVPLLGVAKAGGGEGFDLTEVMEFVGKAYNSANGDTRTAAVRVTKEVFDIVGQAIRKTLPGDINPKIKEQVDAVLDGAAPAGGEGDAVPPPPKSDPAPPKAAKPPPSGKAPARGGKASQQMANVAAGLPPEPEPAPPPAASDDPAPFEEELAVREAELGPDHPDVAETCSNLAILYSQKGQPELALPLGQDDVGRPLLERALAIQEEALGADHPDVLAIRDVLES
eukprot:gene28475-31625_t